MKILYVPSTSREYVRVGVSGKENNVEVDPTGYTAKMSFPAQGTEPSSWSDASWETGGEPYHMRCLVGSGGGVVLAEGRYDIWTQITTPVELIERFVGVLVIT